MSIYQNVGNIRRGESLATVLRGLYADHRGGGELRLLAEELPKSFEACLKIAKAELLLDADRVILLVAALRVVSEVGQGWIHFQLAQYLYAACRAEIKEAVAPFLIHAYGGLAGRINESAKANLNGKLASILADIAPTEAARHASAAFKFDVQLPDGTLDRISASLIDGERRTQRLLSLSSEWPTTTEVPAVLIFDAEPRHYQMPKFDDRHARLVYPSDAVPPVKVFDIENGTLSVDATKPGLTWFYVFDADRRLIPDASYGIAPFIEDDVRREGGVAAIIDDRFSTFNISHLIFDKTTRLAIYDKMAVDYRPILFCEHEYDRKILEILGRSGVFFDADKKRLSVRFDRLLVSSNVKSVFHPAHGGADWAVQAIRRNFSVGESGGDRRVYISRNDAPSRRVINEVEVRKAMQDFGFDIMEFGALPPLNQIESMRSARYVAGVHGAGLTNIVFADPGAKVLEILHPRAGTCCYWVMSQALGHDYWALVADDPKLAGDGSIE